MTTHYDDEAQAEHLKQWWKENWQALAAGLIIGLGAIFGWEAWQGHQSRVAADASRMFEDLRAAIDASRLDDAAAIGDKLAQDYADSPYAAGAALYLASAAVKADQLDAAVKRLAWAHQHASDEGLRTIAALREARVLWQQEKPDAALALLKDNDAGDAGPYRALTEELRGDILLAKGDRPAARAAYEKALTASTDKQAAALQTLQQKIDDLADVVQS